MAVEPAFGWRFLRQARYGSPVRSYSAPSGLTDEDDPDLARVDDVRDPGVGAVAVGQPAQDRERLLEREVLAGVVEPVEQDLGLGLVGRDVVGDLGDPDVAALVALADRADLDDVRVGGLGGLDRRRPSRRRCGSGESLAGKSAAADGRRAAARERPSRATDASERAATASAERRARGMRRCMRRKRSHGVREPRSAIPRWGYVATGTARDARPGTPDRPPPES